MAFLCISDFISYSGNFLTERIRISIIRFSLDFSVLQFLIDSVLDCFVNWVVIGESSR